MPFSITFEKFGHVVPNLHSIVFDVVIRNQSIHFAVITVGR